MSGDKSQIAETISALKQQRDELAVQIHLGNMEAKEEFGKASDKLHKMSEDFEPVKDAIGESASNVAAALQLVGEEIWSSFDRIRKSL